jgi:ectoine hydroxylase-related dioxygenase (phytanoyl-CoA dioxygenase family)
LEFTYIKFVKINDQRNVMLNSREILQYSNDGYLPGIPMLSNEEVAYYRDACLRCCGTGLQDGVRRQASNRVKSFLLYPWAAELVRHQGILDVVESLIGSNILVFHATVWFKQPGTGDYVPWHQDATYFGLDPHEHVTAWVALTDSTQENGCVEVMPGSHALGQRPHRDDRDKRAMLSRGQTLSIDLDESRAAPLLLSAGEISFHHTLLMHRSAPNKSSRPRVGIGISFIPTRVRHITETRLSATLVRGVDSFGHFDMEPSPTEEANTAAVATHADSLLRYHQASESIPEMKKVH